jgi:hypothetical protein
MPNMPNNCRISQKVLPVALPAHAQDNARGFVQKSKTKFLSESKPHAQKLLTQFLRHFPTHHPEIDMIMTALPKLTNSEILKNLPERKEARMARHYIQRAVWHNGGCASLDSTIEQQVKWLVASAGSPPLRQAATTLVASVGAECIYQTISILQSGLYCVF